MNQLISKVLMQPKPDATERPLTLVEKLEQEIESLENSFEQFAIVDDEIAMVHTATIAGLKMAIAIVKQHSDWISADERLPDKDGKYLVYCVGSRELTKDRKELSIMRFNQKTKGSWFALSPLFKVIYWQQIQPPSEVQDD
jgi:hypothetical protein